MPTNEETRLLCLMRLCITLECMYQYSPIHRIDLHKPVPSEAILPLEMLHAHFENMRYDNYTNPDDCISIYKTLQDIAISNPSYKSSEFLQSTIISCISSLLGEKPNLQSKWWIYISGYTHYIPEGPLKTFIGKWLAEKDRMMGLMWMML